MTTRAIVALGIGQCVNWGVLYYAFAVLLLPVERDLGVARWMVTGAFSLALFTSAVLAPTVGKWSDRGLAPAVMQAGGFSAAALFALWALFPTLQMLYLVWLGLGLCMATSLYEPAFVIVGRTYDDPATRLRALATVTVFGGLASTVFLPLAGVLVRNMGWRRTALVLASILAASTFITRLVALRGLKPVPSTEAPQTSSLTCPWTGPTTTQLRFALLAFSVASLASAAFTANLVPAVAERGISSLGAATLGGLLGIMQLPGRALLVGGMLPGSPAGLVRISLALQAVGLAAFALAPSVNAVAVAIAVFAAGAGLTTLVRPHFVQSVFNIHSAGHLNGQLARSQQLARAAGPVFVSWLGELGGYGTVFFVLSAAMAALALTSQHVLNRVRSHHDQPSDATISGP